MANSPCAGHLAGAQLVQDLARLTAVGIGWSGLPIGQDGEGIDGQRRAKRDRLVGAEQRVASEQGGEPGQAGGEQVLAGLWPGLDQQVQVGQGPVEDALRRQVVDLDLDSGRRAFSRRRWAPGLAQARPASSPGRRFARRP